MTLAERSEVRRSVPDAALVREALVEAGEADPRGDPALEPLAGGASRDCWLVTAGARRYVLKRDPVHERTPLTSRAREYEAIRAAAAAGVPVPRPVCCEPADGRFATAGFLCDFVDGTSSPRRIHALDPGNPARGRLVRDVGRAAGLLARAELPEAFGEPPSDPADAALEEVRGGLAAVAPDRPVLALALHRLELERPPAAPAVLVHGDFRLGNFIASASGLAAVVDWEFSGAGDAAQDLAFFCLRPWRYGVDGLRGGGLGTLDELLAGYAETAPEPLDPERVRYWEMVGQLRWGLYCLWQQEAYRRGGHRSLERLMVGPRLAEVEWDLLDLIEAGAS